MDGSSSRARPSKRQPNHNQHSRIRTSPPPRPYSALQAASSRIARHSPTHQRRRPNLVQRGPKHNLSMKQWKLSQIDLKSRILWEEYTKVKEEMLTLAPIFLKHRGILLQLMIKNVPVLTA